MELVGLDANFQPVGYINYLNLQWKRRYYECGSWAAQILEKDYDPRIVYVYSPDRPEFGLVQKMTSQKNIKGRFVMLSGLFLESIFNRQIVFPHIEGTFTLPNLAALYLTDEWYMPDLYRMTADPNNPKNTVSVKWERGRLGDYIYDTLRTLELTHSVVFNPDTLKFTYKIWKGVDRTQSQNPNAFVTFSEDSCYVSDFEYTEDSSNYKNVVMILYGDQPSRYDVYGDNWEQDGRRWQLINCGGDEGFGAMEQQAFEEMQKYPWIHEAQITVVQNGLFYRTDYDLGDKCDIVHHGYQKAFEARISGIDEVFKKGQHTVKLIFGEQSQTTYEKIRNYVDTQRKALGLTLGLNNGGSWST